MAERGSVEWWLELLERYERERGQVTQMEFCEREGVPHSAFMYRMFGNCPHRSRRRCRRRSTVCGRDGSGVHVLGAAQPGTGRPHRSPSPRMRQGEVRRIVRLGSDWKHAESNTRLTARLSDAPNAARRVPSSRRSAQVSRPKSGSTSRPVLSGRSICRRLWPALVGSTSSQPQALPGWSMAAATARGSSAICW